MIYILAPIGVGKTSLAGILSKDLGTKALLEKPEKIPLLNSFCKAQELHDKRVAK